MRGSIPISTTRGIDPHLTYCRRCGGESQELTLGILMKAQITGGSCDGQWVYCNRGRQSETGNNLARQGIIGSRYDLHWEEVTDERERVPSQDICDKCKQEIKEHEDVVKKGGVFFRCLKCGIEGAIKGHTELAQDVRKTHKMDEPDREGVYRPCGIEFGEKEGCLEVFASPIHDGCQKK